MAVDDNRMITFSYAKNNYDTYKIQTIPDTLECMTKDEVKSYISVDQTLLNSLASNQLVRRDKVVGVSYNTPIVFGDKNIYTSNKESRPGYEEYNKLYYGGTQMNAFELLTNTYSFSGGSIVLSNTYGNNFINDCITKLKSLSNFSNLEGWTIEFKITGGKMYGNQTPLASYLFNPSMGGYENEGVWLPDSYFSTSFSIRYLTNILSSGFSPNSPNSSNQISGHEKLSFCGSGGTVDYYQKPNDIVGSYFSTKAPVVSLRNSDYFYFGYRNVIGTSTTHISAPPLTPNFPQSCGFNGAMDVVYRMEAFKIKIEARTIKTSTSEIVNVGSLTFYIDDAS